MTPENKDKTFTVEQTLVCKLNADKKWSDNENNISSKISKVQQNL